MIPLMIKYIILLLCLTDRENALRKSILMLNVVSNYFMLHAIVDTSADDDDTNQY